MLVQKNEGLAGIIRMNIGYAPFVHAIRCIKKAGSDSIHDETLLECR